MAYIYPMSGYYTFLQTLFKIQFRLTLPLYLLERIKDVGPDRACAEWLLRCGAGLKWKGKGI